MSVDNAVGQVTGSNSSVEDFAKYYGFEVPAEGDDVEEAEVASDDDTPEDEDAEVVTTDENDDDAADEEESEPDAEAEPEAEKPPATPAKKLPFSVTNEAGEDIGPTLATANVTFKADGQEHTLPLADVVRRAQSEAGVQRQLRSEREDREAAVAAIQERDATVAELRALAIRAVLDEDYREQIRPDVEQYYSPEARAERAEQQLAADVQSRREETVERQRVAERMSFFDSAITPTVQTLREQYPLVNEQELLGQFMTDTQQWMQNGVIDPQHYPALERYLATGWTKFASERHAERHALNEQITDTKRKAQVAEQKRKNASARSTKPAGGSPGLRQSTATKAPETWKEAHKQGLSVLLDGMIN